MTELGSDLGDLTRRPEPGPHRATVRIAGREIATLLDLPPLPDRLLFVGLSPSPGSVAAGHYHQGRLGRLFWDRLIAAGILPDGTSIPEADDALLAAGHGITDLVKEPSRGEAATDLELRAGVGPLWQKVAVWRPAAVVFISRRAAAITASRPLLERWGQLQGVALSGRPCLLMPGPYGPTADVVDGLAFLGAIDAFLTLSADPDRRPRPDA